MLACCGRPMTGVFALPAFIGRGSKAPAVMSNFQFEDSFTTGSPTMWRQASLACALIVVGDGDILDHVPDALPEVRSEACRIIEERGAAIVEAHTFNAESAFGVVPQWVPGAQVERMLSALHTEHAGRRPAESRTTELASAKP